MRAFALLFAISVTISFAQESSKDPGSFEIEPPLLIPNRGDEPLSDPQPAKTTPRIADLAKLEKEFERAKRNAAGADRLCKIGALSRVEAEQRALRVVHLEFDLANARLLVAKEQMMEKEKELHAGEIAKSEMTPTETNLALAIKAAHSTALKREQADIAAAEANVRRQEKLVALGSGRKSDLSRAVQKLNELKLRGSDLR
jgi:hypothetical protein